MIDADKRQAVFLLYQEGMGRNQIARQLRISPNTVQAIIAQKGQTPVHTRKDKIQVDPDLLQRLYQECDGYAQRVHEKLVEDEHIQIQYSTLTRLLRELRRHHPADGLHDDTLIPDHLAQRAERGGHGK